MKISISQRCRPYSHEPGASCLVPHTCWAVQAFPCLIRLIDCEKNDSTERIDVALSLTGPVREFSVQQDLEKGYVSVWGVAREGRYQIRIEASETHIGMYVDRAPSGGLIAAGRNFQKGEFLLWPIRRFYKADALERLSLGKHRGADWDAIWRRFDLKDILPVLFYLGQQVPRISAAPPCGVFRLLEGDWEPFLRAGFFSILCPRLTDSQHQGLLESETIPSEASACRLVTGAAEKIRRLLVNQKGMEVCIPKQNLFPCGRMTNVHLDQIGRIDFEWRQYLVRQMIVRASHSAEVNFIWPKAVHSLRLRQNLSDRGRCVDAGKSLLLEAGKVYYLDRFQK
jgi:hypothetical protein